MHGIDQKGIAYKYQKLTNIQEIHIKRGSWIGHGKIIMPGVTIGKYSISGANCVINRDIPEYSVAVGAPAKVIKQWNSKLNKWTNYGKNYE
ncbi:acyltransferase [Desulfonatronospira thiodismutans]|uniref:acyltransferase n=1 Tax=Desulfonatronospira thiodismutans TaxID=488939 RepID=UPI0013759325|nr:hypothetical protein [Desulfonatronospira thiodismutans]